MAERLNLDKPVQTKCGQAVRVLCTDAAGLYPIICIVLSTAHEGEYLMRARLDGVAFSCYPVNAYQLIPEYDLVNVKVKRWRWVLSTSILAPWVTAEHYTNQEIDQLVDMRGFTLIGHIPETEIEE